MNLGLDRDQLQNALHDVALPAMAGAAGGGALGAYMSRQPLEGETPSMRRHRILKNALITAGLGGMAGATLPIGLKTLAKPYTGAASSPTGSPIDRAVDFGASHAGVGIGAGLGMWGRHAVESDLTNKAVERVKSVYQNQVLPPAIKDLVGFDKITDLNQLKQVLSQGDAGHGAVLSAMAGASPENSLHRLFENAEILGQATGKSYTGDELKRIFSDNLIPNARRGEDFWLSGFKSPVMSDVDLRGEYLKYLSNAKADANPETWLPALRGQAFKALSKIPSSRIGGLAELYSRYARPGAMQSLGRVGGMLGRGGAAALPLAAMGIGSWAQNKILGD